MSIIGIVLGLTSIGLFFWLKKEQQMNFDLHDGDIEAAKHAYNALMEDFNNYQINTDRKIIELEKQLEIKTKNQNLKIDKIQKELPLRIGQVVSQIEFGHPTNKNTRI